MSGSDTLMRIQMRLDQSGGPAKTLDVAGDRIRLGRAAVGEVAVDPIAFPKVSGLHARIESTARGFVLVRLSRNNKTLLPLAQPPSPGSTEASTSLAARFGVFDRSIARRGDIA